jgi:hypothetical protein
MSGLGNGQSGVSAMIHAAVWLETQLDVEILFIGRKTGLERFDCCLEAAGKHLSYQISLDGGYVFLRAAVLDSIADSEQLLSVGDCKDGWTTICKVVQALERNNIRALERPIECGSGGPNSWVIS